MHSMQKGAPTRKLWLSAWRLTLSGPPDVVGVRTAPLAGKGKGQHWQVLCISQWEGLSAVWNKCLVTFYWLWSPLSYASDCNVMGWCAQRDVFWDLQANYLMHEICSFTNEGQIPVWWSNAVVSEADLFTLPRVKTSLEVTKLLVSLSPAGIFVHGQLCRLQLFCNMEPLMLWC